MLNQEKEVDVDFIGGEAPLTIEEEKMISEFLQKLNQSYPFGFTCF